MRIKSTALGKGRGAVPPLCSYTLRGFTALFLIIPIACSSAEDSPKGTADIQFLLHETYTVGEKVDVTIRNSGNVPYLYNQAYPACDLSYVDSSGRVFRIPEGTHCDQVVMVEIKPDETKTLFEWDLKECLVDQFGCVKSQLLPEGAYTIKGTFFADTDEERFAEAAATFRIVK